MGCADRDTLHQRCLDGTGTGVGQAPEIGVEPIRDAMEHDDGAGHGCAIGFQTGGKHVQDAAIQGQGQIHGRTHAGHGRAGVIGVVQIIDFDIDRLRRNLAITQTRSGIARIGVHRGYATDVLAQHVDMAAIGTDCLLVSGSGRRTHRSLVGQRPQITRHRGCGRTGPAHVLQHGRHLVAHLDVVGIIRAGVVDGQGIAVLGSRMGLVLAVGLGHRQGIVAAQGGCRRRLTGTQGMTHPGLVFDLITGTLRGRDLEVHHGLATGHQVQQQITVLDAAHVRRGCNGTALGGAGGNGGCRRRHGGAIPLRRSKNEMSGVADRVGRIFQLDPIGEAGPDIAGGDFIKQPHLAIAHIFLLVQALAQGQADAGCHAGIHTGIEVVDTLGRGVHGKMHVIPGPGIDQADDTIFHLAQGRQVDRGIQGIGGDPVGPAALAIVATANRRARSAIGSSTGIAHRPRHEAGYDTTLGQGENTVDLDVGQMKVRRVFQFDAVFVLQAGGGAGAGLVCHLTHQIGRTLDGDRHRVGLGSGVTLLADGRTRTRGRTTGQFDFGQVGNGDGLGNRGHLDPRLQATGTAGAQGKTFVDLVSGPVCLLDFAARIQVGYPAFPDQIQVRGAIRPARRPVLCHRTTVATYPDEARIKHIGQHQRGAVRVDLGVARAIDGIAQVAGTVVVHDDFIIKADIRKHAADWAATLGCDLLHPGCSPAFDGALDLARVVVGVRIKRNGPRRRRHDLGLKARERIQLGRGVHDRNRIGQLSSGCDGLDGQVFDGPAATLLFALGLGVGVTSPQHDDRRSFNRMNRKTGTSDWIRALVLDLDLIVGGTARGVDADLPRAIRGCRADGFGRDGGHQIGNRIARTRSTGLVVGGMRVVPVRGFVRKLDLGRDSCRRVPVGNVVIDLHGEGQRAIDRKFINNLFNQRRRDTGRRAGLA